MAEAEGVSPEVEREAQALVRRMTAQSPFGPAFFAGQLAGFARDRCPDPSERLPTVELHLHDGSVLDLCHVIGVAPLWVALAVWERDAGATEPMRTELVQYASIDRVTLRSTRPGGPTVGFDPDRRAALIETPSSPEEALRRAAGVPPASPTRH